jgi:hypothetical protein
MASLESGLWVQALLWLFTYVCNIYVCVCVCMSVLVCMYINTYVGTVYVPDTGFEVSTSFRLGVMVVWDANRSRCSFETSGSVNSAAQRNISICLNLMFRIVGSYLLGLRHYAWERKLWCENAVLSNVTSHTLVENIPHVGRTCYFHPQCRNSRKDNERRSLPFWIRRVWVLRTLCRRDSPLRNPMWESPASCTRIPSHTPGHGLRAEVHVEGT